MINQYPLRYPAVPVAVALAVGILADHWLSVSLAAWLLGAAIAAAAFGAAMFLRGRRGAVRAGLLLGLIVALGGSRHHVFWSVAAPNDISQFAGEDRRLVRLTAIVADAPEIIPSGSKAAQSAWVRPDSSAATLDCRRILDAGAGIAVTGRAALRVSGHLSGVEIGDEIQVFGWLLRPRPSRNPGAYDPAEAYRRQGIGCLVTADHPDAVRLLRRGPISVRREAARVRAAGEALLVRDLSPRTAPVAATLLYGSRAQMDEEIREAFTKTGMLHVLAISGTHVAILALLLWGMGRMFGFSVRSTSLLTMAGVVGYTFLTDCRPPVIRATIFVCLFASARLWHRRAMLPNGLAIAAVSILLWNPSDLFDVGAQLSFLGVLAIVWGMTLIGQSRNRRSQSVDAIVGRDAERGIVRRITGFLGSAAWEGGLISAAAALFTMPLIAGRFHMVSPISVLINIAIAPLSTIMLWLGYLHAGIGLAASGVSSVLALPFDWSLRIFLGLVETGARFKLSHVYVPGPPEWWLAGYYTILFALVFVPQIRRSRGWGWSLLVGWTIAGLTLGMRSAAPESLRCTFLSVGHGGAILVETPSGRTLLYDAGAIQDGRVAQRAVQSALWERRQLGLDAIVISHADIDHFNGVSGLMATLPVGRLLVSQQFLDFNQPAVESTCGASSACGVPIRLIRDGDRIRLDDRVTFRVLHPSFGPPQADDNANSIVLSIEYAGRRILLTGDLEGAGQAALLKTPPCDTDILLAPHHGSRKANSPKLAAWARPKQVIVSASARVDFKALRSAYGRQVAILSTHQTGAITFEIRSDGTVTRSTVRAVPETGEEIF